ncbi:LuxR C-terminal-related transcriptional regulator [Actinoplanes sp. OR16]|uniref:LuxR C-terminal-related transcriptional regulator n=1 Tax=Actinoplanes sp. OR16 TaxID=946334 RepID=UPI00135F1B8E|nr:LuxR C-terminal-related transcriptional regulator [Actinoplanes sp. OR16]
MSILEPVGVGAAEEEVYRHLVTLRAATLDDLVKHIGRESAEIRAALDGLLERGLVGDEGAIGYVPAPPALSLGALIHQRQADLRAAELAVAALAEDYRTARPPADVVEVLTDRETVRRRFLQIQDAARHEVRSMVVPNLTIVPHRENTAEREALRRGVRYRALLDRGALAAPEMVTDVRASLAAGQQIRVVDVVPVKMMIVDEETAFLPLRTDRPESPASILIHRSGLLAVLIAFFETEWERAVPLPIGEDHPGDLDDLDRQVLGLLLAGLTDQAVAGQLGLSLRTVHRRIRQLMAKARVDSRVQLGWVAARKRWV